MSRRFRLDLAYDGTHFEGWQSQRQAGRTVQTELETVLSTILKVPTSVTGAGRTDSGVHARGQTAHFDVEQTRMEGPHFVRALNSLLAPDIRITACQEVDSRFHSRFSALARVYHYHLLESPYALPWEAPYCWRLHQLPPLRELNSMAALLHGELDFTTFSHAQDPSASKNRYIYHSAFFMQGDQLIYRIAGNAFLWRMVRSLVGSLLDFAQRDRGVEQFRSALESRNRRLAGPTAPAKGLFLQKVIYDPSEFAF